MQIQHCSGFSTLLLLHVKSLTEILIYTDFATQQ
uniref:Uncharacterized protein n=1 Tax=Anguilla anguilla TaxID=7936 RepID=A0A0E9SUV4_ANGAN